MLKNKKNQTEEVVEVKKKKKEWPIILGIFMIFGIVVALESNSGDDNPSKGSNDAIEIVQNGYLGEYTSVTIKDALDAYYQNMSYEPGTWDGGVTDSGKEIVAVTFSSNDTTGVLSDVTIQFTMKTADTFKVSAFVDPLLSNENGTDVMAALNQVYVMQYFLENRDKIGDMEFERTYMEKLNQISGSAVLYGAAADYSGNRAVLCGIFGDTALNVTVPLLLDNYGMLDVSPYGLD